MNIAVVADMALNYKQTIICLQIFFSRVKGVETSQSILVLSEHDKHCLHQMQAV